MDKAIRILYVHGYLGSAHGHSSELIRREFETKGIPCILDAPGFDVTNPIKTKEKIKSLDEKNHYDYVVASSLGAFYTMQIPNIRRVLINIALPENLIQIRDRDPEHNLDLSSGFFSELNRERDAFFSDVFNEDFRKQTYVIYGSRDQIAPNEGFFKQYYNDASRIVHIDMDHKLDERGAKKVFELISGDY